MLETLKKYAREMPPPFTGYDKYLNARAILKGI